MVGTLMWEAQRRAKEEVYGCGERGHQVTWCEDTEDKVGWRWPKADGGV